MFKFNSSVKVFIHREPVDMRKSFYSLMSLVQEEMKMNPFDQSLYLFAGRGKDKIKILFWDKTGFVLIYKKLEKETYPWSNSFEKSLEISYEKLILFLDGIDIWKIKTHEPLSYKRVC